MIENQTVEYKQSWRDEYLKWVCGLANANGGILEIGKDDGGVIVALKDATRLLEELPNKVLSGLGIVADVDLIGEANASFIRMTVEPYPYPVSYRGVYYLRSGSTNQQLKGAALDRFILRKQGRHWDDVPQPGLNVDACDPAAFRAFREKAAASGRIQVEEQADGAAEILDGLRLRESGRLKRAAALLFHPDPERFVPGAFVKIGYFVTTDDLRYHNEVRGHLFGQIEQTVDLLSAKYLKADVGYNGLQRVERYPVPRGAVREALLNALVHKDYASGAPVQISVYKDRVIFWNPGRLPDDWTVDRLLSQHPSHPSNPLLADAFFRAGYIEAWGRGIEKMLRACREDGVPEPRLQADATGVQVTFPTSTRLALSRHQVYVLRKSMNESKLVDLMAALGRTDRTKFRNQILGPLLEEGLVEMGRPNTPTSSRQTYRITELGRATLARLETS
ncbi:MAG: transcriptional regulator [Spirochaetaceae bacterium]|nr:MAG: transcriptional regulator [Spirochaetaceae bacterium]